MEDHSPEALRKARKLRREMSLPEVLLWRHLKSRPLGIKFRRQHPVGDYIADFYCAAANLLIEIDGIAHDMGTRPQRDVIRDYWLRSQGFSIVRISAVEVLKDSALIADALVRQCAGPPPSALRAATSPKGGGFCG